MRLWTIAFSLVNIDFVLFLVSNILAIKSIFLPVTSRIKELIASVENYVTGRRKRLRLH